MVPGTLQVENHRCLSLRWDSCCIIWFRVAFWVSWDTLFIFFLSFPLVWFVRFPYTIVFVSFLSPRVPILSWFNCSIPSVMCRFPFFIISLVHFSMPNSIPMCWLYILTACMRVSYSFSSLANSLMMSMDIVIDLFLKFSKFESARAFPEHVIEWHHRHQKQQLW